MTARLKKLSNEFIQGEPVNAEDMNDTLEYLYQRAKVRSITTGTTVSLDDDFIFVAPSSTANTFTTITSGEYYYDKNAVIAGGYAYQPSTSGGGGGGNGMLKINLSTFAVTGFNPGIIGNGYTCHVTDGTYIYFSTYGTALQRYHLTVPALTTFATFPTNVYAIARDTAGNIYGQAYSGIIYKVDTGGTVTTLTSSGAWGSVVGSMIYNTTDGYLYLSAGGSYKINTSTGAITTLAGNKIPNGVLFYDSTDDSILFKAIYSGNPFYCKYNCATNTTNVISKANYGSYLGMWTDGTNYFEGSSTNKNWLSYTPKASLVPACEIALPDPSSDNEGKQITVVFTNTAFGFIVGKMFNLYVYVMGEANMFTNSQNVYGYNHQSFRFVSNGTYWVLLQ